MSPACRTPNAAIPPHSPAATTAHAAANAGPHPATTRPHQPRLRPPTHTQPPNGGFCTTRRTATACRRRVAPLMLQFPHSPAATTPPPATSDGSPGRARPTRPPTPDHPRQQRVWPQPTRPATPGRLPAQPPLTSPLNGGFCTIRRTATACRTPNAAIPPTHPGRNDCHTAVGPAFSPGRHIRRPTAPSRRPTRAAAPLPGHGLGPVSRPPPPAQPSDSTSYSVKTKSDQLNSLKLSQTDPQRTRIHT